MMMCCVKEVLSNRNRYGLRNCKTGIQRAGVQIKGRNARAVCASKGVRFRVSFPGQPRFRQHGAARHLAVDSPQHLGFGLSEAAPANATSN